MKILQIANPITPFPPKIGGGTERIMQYLIDELVAMGHEVTLMGHNDSVVPPDIKFIPIGTYHERKEAAKRVWRHLLTNKYDVIHNHGRLLYFLPVIWSKVCKVHTFHMAELASPAFFRFLALKPRNLTLSPCAKWIQERYSDINAHWQFVYNGLPRNKYQCQNKAVNKRAPLIMICRISPTKGVLHAVEIARQNDRKLILAGTIGDQPHEKEWVKENIEPLVKDGIVDFIGPVTDEQKNALLNEAAALLIPTIDSEAFNTTMLEANACGCPVISYDRFCFSDFIIDGLNGYKGKTIDDLIASVSKLYQIDRQACRKYFEDNYTADIMTANYLKIYKSIS